VVRLPPPEQEPRPERDGNYGQATELGRIPGMTAIASAMGAEALVPDEPAALRELWPVLPETADVPLTAGAMLPARLGPAGPAPRQRVRGQVEEHLAGNVSLRGCRGRKPAQDLEDVSIAGRARRAGHDGQLLRPRELAASCRACDDGRPEPSAAGGLYGRQPGTETRQRGETCFLVTLGHYLPGSRRTGTADLGVRPAFPISSPTRAEWAVPRGRADR
jgi:hypothetical protein